MKILITGASGFVGGSLWRAAQAAGHTVLALGRRPLDAEGYVSCDLSRGLDTDFDPDVVVHAAARSSPWGSRKDFTAQNVAATRQVVDFCEKRGKPYLVHISTAAVMYANEHQLGMDETTALPPVPINLYAATKREAEGVVGSYSGRWCIVRPRAVFGPGDTVVFPRILRLARSGRLPIIEAGQPIVGDLVFIDTLVAYLLRAIDCRATGLYIVTNNQTVPIREFLDAVFDRLGIPPLRRRVSVSRAMAAASVMEMAYSLLPFLGEPPLTRHGVSIFAYSKTFNVAKILRDLGPPSVALDEGIERFVQWQRTQSA